MIAVIGTSKHGDLSLNLTPIARSVKAPGTTAIAQLERHTTPSVKNAALTATDGGSWRNVTAKKTQASGAADKAVEKPTTQNLNDNYRLRWKNSSG